MGPEEEKECIHGKQNKCGPAGKTDYWASEGGGEGQIEKTIQPIISLEVCRVRGTWVFTFGIL